LGCIVLFVGALGLFANLKFVPAGAALVGSVVVGGLGL